MADEVVSEAQTDAVPSAPAEASTSESTGAQPFYTHGERSFATADELTAHLDEERETGRRERLNQRDYAARLEQIKERGVKHEESVRKHNEEVQRFAPWRDRYAKLQQLFQTRPDIARQFQQAIGEAPSAAVVSEREGTARDKLREEIMEELRPVIDAHRQREEDSAQEAMYAEVFGDRESMPHGTDEARVREAIDQIASSADGGRELATLLARAYAYAEAQPASNETNGARPAPKSLPRRGAGSGMKTDDSAKYAGKTPAEIEEMQLAELAS